MEKPTLDKPVPAPETAPNSFALRPHPVLKLPFSFILTALFLSTLLLACTSAQSPEESAALRQELEALYPPEQPYPNSRFRELGGSHYHYRLFLPGTFDDSLTQGAETPSIVPQDSAPTSETGVLLVHGLGASTFSWRHIAPELARQGYPVVAVDLPGFGYSGRFPGAGKTDGQRAADLWELLTTELPQVTHWLLVGHSYGGRITLRMAWEQAERTRAWTGISPAVLGGGGPNPLLGLWPFRGLVSNFLASRFQQPQGLAETLESAFGRPATTEEIQGYMAPFLADDALEAFLVFSQAPEPQAVRDAQGQIVHRRSRDLIPELRVPVHLLWGQEDAWVPYGDARKILDLLPTDLGRVQALEGAGHVAQESHPAETLDFLLGVLEEPGPGEPMNP